MTRSQRCGNCSHEMPQLSVFCPACHHPNEPDMKLLINQTLGNRFQIYRQLSEGGLSTVFAAIDLVTDRTVVVKVSDPKHLAQTSFSSRAELADARQYWMEMTSRMKREVAALTGIDDRNVVRVFASGSISADLSYVVMELLRGKTLRDDLSGRRRIPFPEAARIAGEVASALATIHKRGIVHRDLTPRNIFLCEETTEAGSRETVKLIDFGIAKFPKPAGVATYTQHAVMAGTPGYASPEQFQNLPVDHRSDIYSLGVVLYEMLTGEKPFNGKTATEIALKQLSQEPVRPGLLVPEIPIRLEALVLRMLARDPGARHVSAAEVMSDLGSVNVRFEVPLEAVSPVGLTVFPLASLAAVNPVVVEPAPAPVPLPAEQIAEPDGTEVFKVLAGMGRQEDGVASSEQALMPADEVRTGKFPMRRTAAVAAIAGVLMLCVWIFGSTSGEIPAGVVTIPEVISSPSLPPTMVPEVTTAKTGFKKSGSRQLVAEVPASGQEAIEKGAIVPSMDHRFPSRKELVKERQELSKRPRMVSSTEVMARKEKKAVPTPRVVPDPRVIAARGVPEILPTPSAAPPPMGSPGRGDELARREPSPPPARAASTPAAIRNVDPRTLPTPVTLEPRVFSWQGRVSGVREITLDMPGVPGMVDIPRPFRKHVGVVEPPSPGNGWRRAVLRVFGNGDMSLVVRWLPHQAIQRRQELARRIFAN